MLGTSEFQGSPHIREAGFRGIEHPILFTCECEPVLVRARLWAASPHYPRYAFSFELLDWARVTSARMPSGSQRFCQVLYFRCPFPSLKVPNIVSALQLHSLTSL